MKKTEKRTYAKPQANAFEIDEMKILAGSDPNFKVGDDTIEFGGEGSPNGAYAKEKPLWETSDVSWDE